MAALLRLTAALRGETPEEAAARLAGAGGGGLKADLGDALVARIAPVRGEYERLQQDPGHVVATLEAGEDRVREEAAQRMAAIREAIVTSGK